MSLDPDDWEALRAQGHRMLDDMVDHLSDLRRGPVWQAPSPAARAALNEPLPLAATELEDVHDTFLNAILPFGSGNTHPGFMGWAQGGGTAVGMLAEMLAAGLNANLGGRDHMAIQVELQLVEWARQMFAFPPGASGLFMTGASQANLVGVLIARRRALGPKVREKGLAAGGGQLVAYASRDAHGCVARAMDIAGIGSDNLRRVAIDTSHRMDLTALRAAIVHDRQAGLTPFLIVGTAGTVDVGAVDDLNGLADIAAQEDLALHVDGAFGALAVLSPGLAPLVAGLERADSIAFDFHKWTQVPYDAGFLLVRDGALHKATFAADAAYLSRAGAGLAAGDWWPCDYGPDLSRGFRALKTWFTLKTYGARALGDVIAGHCALAQDLASQIAREPELELLAPVGLNIVCFRHRAPAARVDALNAALVIALQRDGRVAPSLTTLNGQKTIRAALFNHRTGPQDIAALVHETLRLGRDMLTSISSESASR
jgi:aromatic-L-amino-acid decarboxylase